MPSKPSKNWLYGHALPWGTPNDQQEMAHFVVGNQEINWSGANSQTRNALYKPHMNIMFFVCCLLFLFHSKKNTWWMVSNHLDLLKVVGKNAPNGGSMVICHGRESTKITKQTNPRLKVLFPTLEIFFPTCTVFADFLWNQSDCAKPSNFRVAPNCLGVDLETFLKAKKNAEGMQAWRGMGGMGFWVKQNIQTWKQNIQNHVTTKKVKATIEKSEKTHNKGWTFSSSFSSSWWLRPNRKILVKMGIFPE